MTAKRPSVVAGRKRPMLTCVISDETPDACIATIRNAIYEGADAFMLDMCKLGLQYHNFEDLHRIFDYCEDRPVIVMHYRSPLREHLTDQDLVDSLLTAIRAGASMCDIMGDMFNRSPLELSKDPESFEKQCRVVEQVHALGGEVLMSSHTWVPMTVAEITEHAKALQSRGADMVKIAQIANTEEEAMEAFLSTARLKHELDVPYLHVCMGQYGKAHRQISPIFGSSMALCIQQYTERSHKDQALLRATKLVLDNLDWPVARDTSIGTFQNIADFR